MTTQQLKALLYCDATVSPALPPRPFQNSRPWFEVKNQTKEAVDIFLYDEISPWVPGHNARDIALILNNLKEVPTINVRINSPGGSVFDGMAIHNALVRHPGTVNTYVDGIAASIASVIMLAGKTIRIADNAMVMIHNPSGLAWGEAAELRKTADVLDQIKSTIVDMYVSKTGKKKDTIAKLMNEATYFTAKEAKDAKLVDEVTAGMQVAAFDLAVFGYKAPDVKPADVVPPVVQPVSSVAPRSLHARRQALTEKLVNHK